jgi:Rrf2 family protein
MMELAKHHGQGPLALKEMAERQGIPLKYLEQIAIVLKQFKLIRSVRGPFGGYVLTRPPEKIQILEIIEALEGPLTFVHCVRDPSSCQRVPSCAFNELWKAVSEGASKVLKSVSLADMARLDSQKKGSSSACPDEPRLSKRSRPKAARAAPQRAPASHTAGREAKGSKSSRRLHR